MLVDLSILVTKYVNSAAIVNQKIVAFGHLGTHFDVMDKEFPLAFVKRNGIIFNVKGIFDRDISIADIDLTLIEPDMFVAFFSNITEKIEYGSKEYFANHPQLSNELIDQLLKKRISIIGIDFAENPCNMHSNVNKEKYKNCVINTYPIRFAGLSGLPCRVVAEV